MYQKFFVMEKLFWTRVGGLVSQFSAENFSSDCAEKLRGEHFSVSENFKHRKVFCLRKGYHYTLLNFLSHSSDRFRRGTVLFSEKLCYRKVSYTVEWGNHGFVENFVPQCRRSSFRNPPCFSKFLV